MKKISFAGRPLAASHSLVPNCCLLSRGLAVAAFFLFATGSAWAQTTSCATHGASQPQSHTTSSAYVITYRGNNFLGGTSVTNYTSFNPQTCLWYGSSGSTFQNSAGGYLYLQYDANTSAFISTTNRSNVTISGTESGTTGCNIQIGGFSKGYVGIDAASNQWGTHKQGAGGLTNNIHGFSHWRVVSVSGGTITSKAAGSTINAEEEITVVPSGTYTPNRISMEVGLEVVWDVAEVSTSGSFTYDYGVERTFYVFTSSADQNITANSKACTYTSIYPNGTPTAPRLPR